MLQHINYAIKSDKFQNVSELFQDFARGGRVIFDGCGREALVVLPRPQRRPRGRRFRRDKGDSPMKRISSTLIVSLATLGAFATAPAKGDPLYNVHSWKAESPLPSGQTMFGFDVQRGCYRGVTDVQGQMSQANICY
jgi:hypothetical protein